MLNRLGASEKKKKGCTKCRSTSKKKENRKMTGSPQECHFLICKYVFFFLVRRRGVCVITKKHFFGLLRVL